MLRWIAAAATFATFTPTIAEACGCFAAPTVAEPVVQAGEQIVFVQNDGVVTTHVRISYTGDADEFAWLLPVPAVPEFRLGTEALFEALSDNTGPQFVLTQAGGDDCFSGGGGCGDFGDDAFSARAPEAMDAPDIAVVQSSAGPYDYAVIRADAREPMFEWLRDNGYFVESAADTAFAPYIKPGAFFLALKLRAGATTGDLQPVVVEYPSDVPTIPIVLTSISAVRDMPIQVWVFGDARAVPRNYQNVTPNFARLNWADDASNYAELVTRAIDEAEDGQAFVTEYAGPSNDVRLALGEVGRFGNRGDFDLRSPTPFVRDLQNKRFRPVPLRPILATALLIPDSAFDTTPIRTGDRAAVDAEHWRIYGNYAGLMNRNTFTSSTVANEIWERVVEPHYDAIETIAPHDTLTRMLTFLSPDEMTEDPAFVFNPDLPEVPRQYDAVQRNHCDGSGAELELREGRVHRFEEGDLPFVQPTDDVPYAALITNIGQEGPPQIVVDNRPALENTDDLNEGCTHVTTRRRRGLVGLLIVMTLVLLRKRYVR